MQSEEVNECTNHQPAYCMAAFHMRNIYDGLKSTVLTKDPLFLPHPTLHPPSLCPPKSYSLFCLQDFVPALSPA